MTAHLCYSHRVRTLPRALAASAALFGLVALPRVARADASAWGFVGAGPMFWKQTPSNPAANSATPSKLSLSPTLVFDAGMGTSPEGKFIVGGLARVMPVIGHGTDLGLMVRGATGGFQGGLGLALDLGGYWRSWGDNAGGFMGDLVFGGPVGLELRLTATVGSRDGLGLSAVAGIDLLRLTVFRKNTLSMWPNPNPAPR